MAKSKKYFGTDGIRGKAGEGKLSKDMVARLARCIGYYLTQHKSDPVVIIGRDTRESGHWMEEALVEGLQAFGVTVYLLGVIPTAAISYLTADKNAELGIVITASHNPYWDNGIKFFGPDGRKLDDDFETAIEALLDTDVSLPKGKERSVQCVEGLKQSYQEKLVGTLELAGALAGLSVVVDCANGSAFETAPAILHALGVEDLTVIGASPDGLNINRDCGSTHPEKMCEMVRQKKADVGIALDGDADRLIMCDEKGDIIDGDQIMGALVLSWQAKNQLVKPVLVATVMSNLGLERLMDKQGIEFIRTGVGDRFVAAAMLKNGYNLGGEQSGHILMPDYLPTGDGMLAAIQILSVLAESKNLASQALRLFEPVPQLLVNVRYDGQSPLHNSKVVSAINRAEIQFEGQGRLLIRASGTEPVIRVMAEGDNPDQVHEIVHNLADVIRKA